MSSKKEIPKQSAPLWGGLKPALTLNVHSFRAAHTHRGTSDSKAVNIIVDRANLLARMSVRCRAVVSGTDSRILSTPETSSIRKPTYAWLNCQMLVITAMTTFDVTVATDVEIIRVIATAPRMMSFDAISVLAATFASLAFLKTKS